MKLPAHKCSLTITHNEHLDCYESAEEYVSDDRNDLSFKDEESKARAIATNNIWTIQWYPDTPIGFYKVASPTLEECVAYALKVEAEVNAPPHPPQK